MGVYLGVGGRALDLLTGEYVDTFVSGVTQPYYVETVDFTGDHNVGIPAGTTLTPYAGNGDGNQIIQITDGARYENILFSGQVEVRSAATFVNCRFLISPSFVRNVGLDGTTAITKAAVLMLNGANTKDAHFQNCEIHVRCQRAFNGFQGRNATFDKCVVTGAIDPFSESAGGSAPNTGFGFTVTDSCVPSVAWWYANPANSSEIHSDTGSHSDAMQKNTTLTVTFDNCTLTPYASELIGTGTPGGGRDAGGTFTPPSGTDYTASQSQMETWRNQFTAWTNAAQTMGGISRRNMTAGSMAAFMLNLGNITIRHCWLDAGTVTVNAVDPDVIGSTVHLIDNTFWNGMLNGPGSRSTNPAVKGYAVLTTSTQTFGTYTGNVWASDVGGGAVTITRL